MRLGKESRQLFQFLVLQSIRKVGRVLLDDLSKNAYDVGLRVAFSGCRALLLHYSEIQILGDVRIERPVT
jgi:hypothetical protein